MDPVGTGFWVRMGMCGHLEVCAPSGQKLDDLAPIWTPTAQSCRPHTRDLV